MLRQRQRWVFITIMFVSDTFTISVYAVGGVGNSLGRFGWNRIRLCMVWPAQERR